MKREQLSRLAAQLRYFIIEVSCRRRIAHLGSGLSCADILTALYWRVMKIDPARPDMPERDRFMLSKGHAASVLYCALAMKGYIPRELPFEQARPGGILEEHPALHCVPGVENMSGSLGHALSFACGVLLGAGLKNEHFRTYVLMGDGEIQEGTVWEAAMFAAAHQLGSLCAIVDFNKWQATGRSCEITALEKLEDKFRAFGWRAERVNGHDLDALTAILDFQPDQRPVAVIADTVKGKGVSFMEDDNNWHYRIPNEEELLQAAKELEIS